MMSIESRLAKLEESAGVTGGDCSICQDVPYLPDAVNTDNLYYAHCKCWNCGRMFSLIVEIVESRKEVA
jgi:hypothetical protein